MPRYAITTALAWGPLIAFGMELTGRWAARIFAVVVVWFWFVSVTREVGSKRAFASAVDEHRVALQRAQGMRVPVVLASIHVMYPLVAADWGRGSPSVFVDVPDSALTVLFPETGQQFDLLRRATTERDLARVHSRRFGFPDAPHAGPARHCSALHPVRSCAAPGTRISK
ncbi:MAG: hypothetical protein WD825_02220 [Gemmatimonadaceae bacterium]